MTMYFIRFNISVLMAASRIGLGNVCFIVVLVFVLEMFASGAVTPLPDFVFLCLYSSPSPGLPRITSQKNPKKVVGKYRGQLFFVF